MRATSIEEQSRSSLLSGRVAVAGSVDSGRIGRRLALEVTCLHDPGPRRMLNRIRAENGSSPGKKSPDISIGTSRRFGDGKSTRGYPFIGIGMRNWARSTPTPENWTRGLRADGKMSMIRGEPQQAHRDYPSAFRLHRYYLAALTTRSISSAARRKLTFCARAGGAPLEDSSRSRSSPASPESERRDLFWNLRGPLPSRPPCSPDGAIARSSSPMRRGWQFSNG